MEELERLIEIRRELFSLKNKTKRAFSSVVRAKGEMTDEFKKISDELNRVSQEFTYSIELIEEMIRLNCKKVIKKELMPKILLTIEIDEEADVDKRCVIRNYFNGELNESYRPTSVERGAVDMVALILGFRPPRVLESRDIPAD